VTEEEAARPLLERLAYLEQQRVARTYGQGRLRDSEWISIRVGDLRALLATLGLRAGAGGRG
jgi:hypothetical protein